MRCEGDWWRSHSGCMHNVYSLAIDDMLLSCSRGLLCEALVQGGPKRAYAKNQLSRKRVSGFESSSTCRLTSASGEVASTTIFTGQVFFAGLERFAA